MHLIIGRIVHCPQTEVSVSSIDPRCILGLTANQQRFNIATSVDMVNIGSVGESNGRFNLVPVAHNSTGNN